MSENGIFGISGIKCDSCDWKDMSVRYDDYDQWLNKPCPECNANLLTEADYRLCKAIEIASAALGMSRGEPEDFVAEGATTFRANMNGSGELGDFEVVDKDQP